MKHFFSFYEQQWTTDLGAYFPGERVVLNGKDLFNELQHLDWMGLLMFGITRRMPSKQQVRLFNAIWSLGASYPDPRLWNNRIGTLAGAARSSGALGISAGIAVSEAIVYGNQPVLGAIHLLQEIKQRRDKGETLVSILNEKMSSHPDDARPAKGRNRKIARIPGFGRPVSSRDERIPPLMTLVKELGFAGLPMIQLALEMESVLLDAGHAKMFLNIAGFMAALFCDQGFSAREQYYLWILCFSAGISFCAADAARHPEGSFFPLRCTNIVYEGKPPRKYPQSV